MSRTLLLSEENRLNKQHDGRSQMAKHTSESGIIHCCRNNTPVSREVRGVKKKKKSSRCLRTHYDYTTMRIFSATALKPGAKGHSIYCQSWVSFIYDTKFW